MSVMSDLIERGGIPEGDKVETLMTEPRDTGLWEERWYSVRPGGGLHSRHG